jgi:hypothetical protein
MKKITLTSIFLLVMAGFPRKKEMDVLLYPYRGGEKFHSITSTNVAANAKLLLAASFGHPACQNRFQPPKR